MTSSYTPRPALKIDSGYLVFHTVQKRYPAFLRCQALHFLVDTEFSETEIAATPLDFRNAVARLPAAPILGPLQGGVPLIMYLAGRGLEEDFTELVDEIQESGQRLFDLPDRAQPILVAFGDADAIEDQQLNPGQPRPAVEVPPAPPSPPESAPAAEPVVAAPSPEAASPAPPAAPLSESEPGESTPEPERPATAAEPVPVQPETPPAPGAVEIPAPAIELPPAGSLEPEPTPQPEPVAAAAPIAPQPEPEAARLQPVLRQPEAPTGAPTVLALGSDYYALRTPDTSGTSVVVWQARRLPAPPESGEFQILQPTAETHERLVADARSGLQYADGQTGELVAIKLGLRGREADLERSHSLLRRIGLRGLRLFYPNPAVAGSAWPADFPSYVVEWVSGASITDSPAFSEPAGLEILLQILDLIQAARAAAPDVLLTDGLKPSNIIVTYDERGAARARLIDWNVFGVPEAGGLQTFLGCLGETMADLFADIRPESYSDLTALGLGRPGDPTLGTWDSVSTGTRTLIRRVLRNEFGGDADAVVAEIARLVAEQRARWTEDDPLWQLRLTDVNAEKLNWLDIAAAKLGNLSSEARARLDESRVNETMDLVAGYAARHEFYEAVFDLRVANRRYPGVSFFRWALLANTVATLSPEGAYKRLRLDEALTLMGIEDFGGARRSLDHGVAFFEEVQFEPANRELARDYVSALSMCAQTLALAESGAAALVESWNVEDAEAKLSLAEDRLGRYERLAGDLLHGRDSLCLAKIESLRGAIADFYTKHGRYDPYAARRETTEQARRANFNRLIERTWKLVNSDKPADWPTAMLLLDRAATEFPDLWQEDHERERTTLGGKIGARKLAEAVQALAGGNWAVAGATLAAAMLYPTTHDEAARLQSALWTYQLGEIELKRNEAAAALASFSAAAEIGPELRPAAEAGAQKARDLGGAAGGAAVSRELASRFADQQAALQTIVHGAALAAQEQALAKQIEALKQSQAELAAAQAASAGKLQVEQDERLQSAITRLQRELRDQQSAVIKKAEDEQSAQMQKLVVQITDESSENQKQALAQFQKETSARLKELQETQPDWFARSQQSARKAQEEQDQRLAATLKTIEATAAWLRDSSKKPETAAQADPADAALDAAVKDLTWKVEGVTTTLDKVQGRVGAVFGLNLLLFLGLAGTLACLGAYIFLPGIRSRLPLPGGAATAVAAPSGTVPSPTQAVGTIPATAASTAAVAVTGGVLACSNADQALRFYDCVVTNTTGRPQAFDLTIEPDQVNGFFYSVQVEGQSVPPASGIADLAPGAAQFALGTFGTQDSRPLRVSLACTSGSGCKTTLFRFVVTAEGQGTIKDNEVRVSTSYSQP